MLRYDSEEDSDAEWEPLLTLSRIESFEEESTAESRVAAIEELRARVSIVLLELRMAVRCICVVLPCSDIQCNNELCVQVADVWLSIKQAQRIIRYFPSDKIVPSARVKAAVSIYSRVIDLDHARSMINVLSSADRAKFANRIGWLNL